MNSWWLVARSSGFVAFAMLIGATLSGNRIVGVARAKSTERDDLHRVLATTAIGLIVIHVVALVRAGFVDFGYAEALLPNLSLWRPGPVSWGIVAAYILIVIHISALAARSFARNRWRRIHDHSYVAFALVTIHVLSAGSDVARWFAVPVLVAIGTVIVVICARSFARTRAGSLRSNRD